MKLFADPSNYDFKRFRMRRTLMKHRSSRSDSEISEASEVLQFNPFLSKFVENNELKNLIQLMNLEFFEQGEVLFKEGDIGDKFYIIYEGRIGISIGNKGLVSELKKGDSFGELSLLFGQPRSGTASVLEKTELITLCKDSYEQIIKVK
jgi:CRP-like cAMP-binding protein